MKAIPIDFSGGVNLLRDRRYIAENELVYAKNLVPTKSGLMAKRPPRGVVLNQDGGPVEVLGVNSRGFWITDIPGADFMVCTCDEGGGTDDLRVYTFVGDSSLADATWTQLAIPHTVTRINQRPAVATLNHKMYLVAGYEAVNRLVSLAGICVSGAIIQADALTGQIEIVSLTFTGTQTVIPSPRVLALYRERMVYADFGPGMEDWLIFSDRQQPTIISPQVLASNGRNYRLGGVGRCTALREVLLTATGTPTETVLLAFKERSLYIIQGEPGQTAATTPEEIQGSLVVQRVNTDAGCASPETIVQTPYGLLWAGPDDVWFMAGGSVPVRVGSKIRPILEASPAEKRYLWHACYYNGFYRLSLFSEGQGPTDFTQCGEQWWLDLRDGAPENHQTAKWWGPMVYSVVQAITEGEIGSLQSLPSIGMQGLDNRDGKQSILYGIENDYFLGTTLQSYDTAGVTGRDGVIAEISSTQLDYLEITTELRTSEADYGDPGAKKGQVGLELSVAASGAVHFEDAVHFDGGRRVITNAGTVPQTGFVLDVGVLDSSLLTREFSAKVLRPDPEIRSAGITIQHHIRDVPGYFIDETNNLLRMGIDLNESPLHPVFDVELFQGFYVDIGELWDEICAALAAATVGSLVPATFSHDQTLPRISPVATLTVGPLTAWTVNTLYLSWADTIAVSPFIVANPIRSKLGAQLGFDVVNGGSGGVPWFSQGGFLDTFMTTDIPVASRDSAHFELGSLIDYLNIFKRRPT